MVMFVLDSDVSFVVVLGLVPHGGMAGRYSTECLQKREIM